MGLGEVQHCNGAALSGTCPAVWGNAQFEVNQLKRIYIQHATRCVIELPKGGTELAPDNA